MDNLNEKSEVEQVLLGGYCIGCGSCAVEDPSITIKESFSGLPQAELSQNEDVSSVCPFATSKSEDEIARPLYEMDSKFDQRIGYYKNNYIGYAAEDHYRKNGSSGGMVSWVLAELLKRGEIDGVIHVAEGGNEVFEYKISESIDDVKNSSKSRYYPVHYNEALKEILGNGKRYAFVGVPCFVKSIRLLAQSNSDVAKSIKFCISIFCGHFKTKAFAEMIAMQQGVLSPNISAIDFRVKDPKKPANKYGSQVFFTDKKGRVNSLPPVSNQELYGLDWGLGYFKPKACDWCDDIAGETADLSCGDAWLPETVNDPLGTNILISRNRIIDDLLKEGIAKGSVVLTDVPVDKIYESQAGNYRHRQEGLSVRIGDAAIKGLWVPKKRISQYDYNVSPRRKKIYRLRGEIAEYSHVAFAKGKEKNSFLLFMLKMLPLELRYHFLNKRLTRGSAKFLYHVIHYLKRRVK